MAKEPKESVNHPQHYNALGATCRHCDAPIECIDVVEKMGFNLGNAVKYLWRHDHKGGFTDLEKAIWYIKREIQNKERKAARWLREVVMKQKDAPGARSRSSRKQQQKKQSPGKASKSQKAKASS